MLVLARAPPTHAVRATPPVASAGEDLPAAGFGFGDAVIVELLKTKDLLPKLESDSNAVLVACQDEELRPRAMAAAAAMRDAGMKVDMVLEPKKFKWIFKHADRVGVGYVRDAHPTHTPRTVRTQPGRSLSLRVCVHACAWCGACAGM